MFFVFANIFQKYFLTILFVHEKTPEIQLCYSLIEKKLSKLEWVVYIGKKVKAYRYGKTAIKE